MPYWPSYSSISPEARRSYLRWQAEGRIDPEIGVGHVFLHLYGLERRALIDRAMDDVPAIAAEVRRLLTIYGANFSFHSYATALLDVLDVVGDLGGTVLPEPSVELGQPDEMPLHIRYCLGRRLADGAAFGAKEGLVWALAGSGTSMRTPAIRCFDELERLWGIRFAATRPDGLKVSAPSTTVAFSI